MQRLPVGDTLLSRRSRPFRSIDHWISAEVCFVAIGSLGRAKKMSQCRVFRSTTVAIRREGKRKTIAYMEAASCS